MIGIRWFVCFFTVWSALLVGFNFLIDPVQFYRKADNPVFVKNQRYQIPGLIKNYPYDGIIVGTSLSENFVAKEADILFRANVINMSISGSSSWEQSKVVKLALANRPLKLVLWELNYRSFAGINPNLIGKGKFPEYLYDETLLSPLYYLFSIDTLWKSVKNLLGNGPRELAMLNSWYESAKYRFGGEYALKHYCGLSGQAFDAGSPNYSAILKEQLASVIEDNPDTTFYLYIPPQSVLNFMLDGQEEKFSDFRRELYATTNKMRNVVFVDFVTQFEVIGDLKRYKDIEHYDLNVSTMMLNMLSNKAPELDKLDYRFETEQLRKFVNEKKVEYQSSCRSYLGF